MASVTKSVNNSNVYMNVISILRTFFMYELAFHSFPSVFSGVVLLQQEEKCYGVASRCETVSFICRDFRTFLSY